MDDLISRESVYNLLRRECSTAVENHLADKIRQLPSAQPERKTGKWLIRKGIADAQCSECRMYFNDVYDVDNFDAFCRHCGTKMEGLKVVEDERFDRQTGGDRCDKTHMGWIPYIC